MDVGVDRSVGGEPAQVMKPYFSPQGAAGVCVAPNASRSRRSTASRSRMRSMAATFSSQVRLAACLRQAALARATLLASATIGKSPSIGSGVASFIDLPTFGKSVSIDQAMQSRAIHNIRLEKSMHARVILGSTGLQGDGTQVLGRNNGNANSFK